MGAQRGLLAARAQAEIGLVPTGLFLLTVLGQLFAIMIFTAAVVGSTRSVLEMTDSLRWLLWVAAFWVSGSAGWMPARRAARLDHRTSQYDATALSAPLGNPVFFWFAFFPESADAVFGWVPITDFHFRLDPNSGVRRLV